MYDKQVAVRDVNIKAVLDLGYTQDQIDVIKATVAKDATNNELMMFMSLARKYNLDPFAREIWFIKSGNTPMIQTARDGFLKVARADERFKGIQDGAVYTNDEFSYSAMEGSVTHKVNFKDRGELVGAWCRVEKEGNTPYICFVDFSEYYSGNKNPDGTIKQLQGRDGKTYAKKPTLWDEKPAVMIKKVAHTVALRMMFGLSGMYAPEEIAEFESSVPDSVRNSAINVDEAPVTVKLQEKKTPKTKPIEVVEVDTEDMITPDQVTKIKATWGEIAFLRDFDQETSNVKYGEVLKANNVDSCKDFSKDRANLFIKWLEAKIHQINEQQVAEDAKKTMPIEDVEKFINS